jgi:hypothetical protein
MAFQKREPKGETTPRIDDTRIIVRLQWLDNVSLHISLQSRSLRECFSHPFIFLSFLKAREPLAARVLKQD